ncbi:uncharacterized protein LOC132759306 [Ruditapes philippinarum]|uniref:uncharacterized protein LOC132759306 n=1 Tax=Ruditapes philippinarum TaxID=129788 RepID=UPI00295B2C61|nr:uncharacterized protein LOC132759306 [Ruditapes philippinarum]
MELKTACACFLVFSLLTYQNVNASDKDVFKILFERIDRLEINDVANKREIASLKAEIKSLKINALETENGLISEIKELKSRLLDSEVKQRAMENGLEMNDSDTHPSKGRQSEGDAATFIQHASKVERKSVTVREAVENEVAFYTTHSQHDVQHLGQNQIIVFDQAVTNVGNAYSSQRGEFVAPVDGTYVFHVTMMGKDVHAVTSKHFNAYIDVSGKPYSQLWVEPYQQSSQMFVINLTAGKIVSVKNRVQDDGFIGQHMSTFSGFLLYQNYGSTGSIIGK